MTARDRHLADRHLHPSITASPKQLAEELDRFRGPELGDRGGLRARHKLIKLPRQEVCERRTGRTGRNT